jgi:GAF domain-containing protein
MVPSRATQEQEMLSHRFINEVFGINEVLGACTDETQMAAAALRQALTLMNARMGNVQLADWANFPSLSIAVQKGFGEEFLNCFRSVSKLSHSACGRALLQRRAIVIEDVLEDEEFRPYRGVAARAGFRSVQSPLLSPRGSLLGVFSTHLGRPALPSAQQLEALGLLAESAASAIIRLRVRNGSQSNEAISGRAPDAAPVALS